MEDPELPSVGPSSRAYTLERRRKYLILSDVELSRRRAGALLGDHELGQGLQGFMNNDRAYFALAHGQQ